MQVSRVDIEREAIEHPGLVGAGVLKAIGFWNGHNEERFVDPRMLVNREWEKDNRDKIIAYLRGFSRINHQMGFSYCRFKCDNERSMFTLGCAEITDGIWIWPEGLAHYVENHYIKLPTEFIDDMKRNDFRCVKDVGHGAIDYGFWIDWCSKVKVLGRTGWTHSTDLSFDPNVNNN